MYTTKILLGNSKGVLKSMVSKSKLVHTATLMYGHSAVVSTAFTCFTHSLSHGLIGFLSGCTFFTHFPPKKTPKMHDLIEIYAATAKTAMNTPHCGQTAAQ